MIQKDGRVADIYAEITRYQQNGIRLLDELKQKLNGEVKNITREEVKGLKRICAFEYYEVAFYFGGTLLFDQLERDVATSSPEMTSLVHTVVGEHFMLFDDGNELAKGKTLGEDDLKINGRVGNHLTGLPFTIDVLKEAGGIRKDCEDAFEAYCQISGLKRYDNWHEVENPRLMQSIYLKEH